MKLLKFVQNKKNKISKVIVYKYSRFSRKNNNGLYLEALLAKKKDWCWIGYWANNWWSYWSIQ